MRRAPIRARLTAWYVLVLGAVLVALGAFVVTRLRSDLTSEVDRSLGSAAAQISHGYRVEGEVEFRDVAHTVLPGPQDEGSGAQVLGPDGRVALSVGDPVTSAPLIDSRAAARALAGKRELLDVRRGSTDAHLRVVAVPTERKGRRQVLAVAETLEDVDDSVHRVLVLLLVGGAASLVLVALGGWWIARKALQPVDRMTTRADEIGVHDLSQRIDVPRVEDEVGHLARTLNAMLGRLEQGMEARERLVADASHELRAPLAAMRAELEVSLRGDELAGESRAILQSARDEVVKLGRVVDNLLTLARVDEGRLELLAEPQQLGELVERVVNVHRAAAAVAGVELSRSGDAVEVTADGDRLGQVLGNLVHNAIRYATAAVQVSTWADGDEAGFRVSDDGPGVPPEARERIFERFSREDTARGRTGGAGLGLAISREIVLAHYGRIRVEAREPHGTVFVVALPRR